MERYAYDSNLTWQLNRRRAIQLHEKGGPMVAIRDKAEQHVMCFVFPDGCTLGTDPMEHPREPDDPRVAAYNVHLYWTTRLKRAEERFNEVKRSALKDPHGGCIEELKRLRDEHHLCHAMAVRHSPPAIRAAVTVQPNQRLLKKLEKLTLEEPPGE